ncbi:MAG: 3-isopropylmalate dehydratase small subunit [Acidobacteriota bacterium]
MNSRALLSGRARVFGDHVDTDVIIPARHCATLDVAELGRHAMEGLDPEFSSRVGRGDVVVAGRNFGCGSSRETAPLALLGAGVGAVVAVSFARIFFRNALNVGLPIFECPDGVAACAEGDLLEIDPSAGTLTHSGTGRIFRLPPYPQELIRIVDAGGLVPYVRRRLGLD